MKSSGFDIVVFDLDGTLIDSKKDIADSLNWTLAKLGYDPIPMKTIESFVGNGIMPLIKRSVEAAGHPDRESEALDLFRSRYWERLLDTTRPFPGVLETIGKLHGGYGLAVVSNKMESYTRKILEGLDMDRFFGGLIYGGDSLPVKKPDPAALLQIAEKLNGSPDRMVFVGDSSVDIQTGKNAGAVTVAVSYGYRDTAELLEEKPDYMIDRFDRILEILENHGA